MSTAPGYFHRRVGAAVAAVAAFVVTTYGIADGIRPDARTAPPSVAVTYAGLDLSQPAGAQLLYRRLQQASSKVCGRIDQVNIAGYPRWQRCYDAALQRAVLQVNVAELLAVYRSEAGHVSNHRLRRAHGPNATSKRSRRAASAARSALGSSPASKCASAVREPCALASPDKVGSARVGSARAATPSTLASCAPRSTGAPSSAARRRRAPSPSATGRRWRSRETVLRRERPYDQN